MSCGLSGRYDSVAVFATQCNDYEQDVVASHSYDLNSLLAVCEPRVDFFQTVRIFEGSNRIRKIHAVLAKVVEYRIPVVPATYLA
jgi:hypothetical protein